MSKLIMNLTMVLFGMLIVIGIYTASSELTQQGIKKVNNTLEISITK